MLEIWIAGRGVGKARPRFGRNGAIHTCNRYGEWKTNAILQLLALKLPPAPKPAKIECLFVNFASSDADNLTGSVLDALVQAEVLDNDSSSYVVECSGKFVKTQKRRGEEKPVGILIRISQAEVDYLDLELISHNIQSVA